MRRQFIHIISIFFLLVFVARGSGVSGLLASDLDQQSLWELMATQDEENKPASSLTENNAEELFDHSFYYSTLAANIVAATTLITARDQSGLPSFYAEVQTPPPDHC